METIILEQRSLGQHTLPTHTKGEFINLVLETTQRETEFPL